MRKVSKRRESKPWCDRLGQFTGTETHRRRPSTNKCYCGETFYQDEKPHQEPVVPGRDYQEFLDDRLRDPQRAIEYLKAALEDGQWCVVLQAARDVVKAVAPANRRPRRAAGGKRK